MKTEQVKPRWKKNERAEAKPEDPQSPELPKVRVSGTVPTPPNPPNTPSPEQQSTAQYGAPPTQSTGEGGGASSRLEAPASARSNVVHTNVRDNSEKKEVLLGMLEEKKAQFQKKNLNQVVTFSVLKRYVICVDSLLLVNDGAL